MQETVTTDGRDLAATAVAVEVSLSDGLMVMGWLEPVVKVAVVLPMTPVPRSTPVSAAAPTTPPATPRSTALTPGWWRRDSLATCAPVAGSLAAASDAPWVSAWCQAGSLGATRVPPSSSGTGGLFCVGCAPSSPGCWFVPL